ncbi:TOBE domain-containing protein [Streptomyces sp. NPDC089915]|uniref:TOBE domain-containing protein n=1 Tax=Streptomyces sp. NPDC089915 TaxID=3155186 RepID=UPI00342E8FE4
MPSYSIGQAAGLLRVSPETVRRWADSGRLPARRASDGTRAVDGPVLAAFAKERAAGLHPVPEGATATSVRNSFAGIVTAVRVDDVAALVEIQSGPHRIVSVVTRESVEQLGIAVGVSVTARVKSTEVYVDVPLRPGGPGGPGGP